MTHQAKSLTPTQVARKHEKYHLAMTEQYGYSVPASFFPVSPSKPTSRKKFDKAYRQYGHVEGWHRRNPGSANEHEIFSLAIELAHLDLVAEAQGSSGKNSGVVILFQRGA